MERGDKGGQGGTGKTSTQGGPGGHRGRKAEDEGESLEELHGDMLSSNDGMTWQIHRYINFLHYF